MARFTIGESIKFYLMGKDFHKLLKRKDSDAGERERVLNELSASLFNDLRTSDGVKHQQQWFCGPRMALSFNFIVAVGIIMINKLLLGKVGFNYPIFLTLVHYGLSWIFMAFLNAICLLPTAPPVKSTPFSSFVALGVVTAFSNGLANVSLKFNSVGFYQMAKIAVTPTIVLTEFLFFGKRVSFQKALSLMVVSFGVAIATVTDLQFNLFGALVALAWIVPSATNKILWSNLQQQDNWTALGLMWKTTPVTVFSLVALMPWLDPPGLLTFNWNISNTLAILISAALGFLLQWSGALALGATSATTHVVLGQFKTCVILLGGFLVFQSDPGTKSVFGATMALTGMSFYTYLNLHETHELLVKQTIIKQNSFSSLKPKTSKSSGDNHDEKDGTDFV
uniref:Sugar phosphate transporter domain-containing protein n=1 Tax=Picea sitchensis TaxID=3332 RepID=D5ADB2_PICSI|nr:unknown [Picea sitchensis]